MSRSTEPVKLPVPEVRVGMLLFRSGVWYQVAGSRSLRLEGQRRFYLRDLQGTYLYRDYLLTQEAVVAEPPAESIRTQEGV